MTQAVITKLKTQNISLPKTWMGKRVLVRVTDNTATITKLNDSPTIFSKTDIEALRTLGKKVNKSILKKALANR